MRKKYLLLMFFALCWEALAASALPLMVGEQRSPDYGGPFYPYAYTYHWAKAEGPAVEDEALIFAPFERAYGHSFIFIGQFVRADLILAVQCSWPTLSTQHVYLRYLNRLLALSYLYEALQHYRQLDTGTGQLCRVHWPSLLAGCRPRSVEMQKFQQRALSAERSGQDHQRDQRPSLSTEQVWQELGSAASGPATASFFGSLLLNLPNPLKSKPEMEEAIAQACQREQALFTAICSEQDQLMGLSSIPLMQDILAQSVAFPMINQSGQGKGCLRIFGQIGARQEVVPDHFEALVAALFFERLAKQESYLEGALFVPGAMKEFEQKGVADLVYNSATTPPVAVPRPPLPPLPQRVVSVSPRSLPSPQPKPPVPAVVASPSVRAPASIPAPARVPALPLRPAFEEAQQQLVESDRSTVAVDMKRFQQEYQFSPLVLYKLHQRMAIFKTRTALTDMRDLDGLGSKEAPCNLKFLKYFIDEEDHHALYNIVAILGERFYLVNDFVEGAPPVYAQLKVNPAGSWQITLVKH